MTIAFTHILSASIFPLIKPSVHNYGELSYIYTRNTYHILHIHEEMLFLFNMLLIIDKHKSNTQYCLEFTDKLPNYEYSLPSSHSG